MERTPPVPALFANDDTAIDPLAHEAVLPLAVHRHRTTSEFNRVVPWANRRRNPRVDLSQSYARVLVEAEAVSGLDLSLRGLQFSTVRRISPGASVTIGIEWPDGTASMALGRVVWATFERPNLAAPAHYRVGASIETWDLRSMRAILERCGLGRVDDIERVEPGW